MVIAIVAIVSAVIFITGKVTAASLTKREQKKDYIQTLMYNPVYINGFSLESVRMMYPDLYRNNPSLFRQYYEDYMSMRLADIEAEEHPLITQKKNEKLYRQLLTLSIIVVMLLFINKLYN
jgi:hypothetical protein